MTEAMIVAPQPEAAEAGARVLKKGGNAIDAAMTAALVQGVVDPQMTGIAGFGNCQIYLPEKNVHTCIDFHGKTPLHATETMWADRLIGETRDGFGFVLRDHINDLGYQSITTPGSLMAYAQAIENYGSWDWQDICAPAIQYARNGFVIRPCVHSWWTSGASLGRVPVSQRLGYSSTGRNLYFQPDGSFKAIGQKIINKDLANTLERIARNGPDIFYRGEIAEQIASDMAEQGGLLSLQDLENYNTTEYQPLQSSYRGMDIATNRPPGGGIMLLQMMNTLENFDLGRMGHNSPRYIQTVCEVMKAATADKEAHIGDPAFIDVPINRLISKQYARSLADRIKSGEKMHVERFNPQTESPDTTHVAVIDSKGTCITMTHSLGMPSGVITPGLGFMYNGCMGVFDPRPGRTGSVAPGKSRFSSLCPTIVFNHEQPHIVLGAPGGTQIAMGVLQALLNVIDFGMSMSDAVAAPRFSATSNVIDIMNRIPQYSVEPLVSAGYEVIRSPLSFGIAGVHGIELTETGLQGGADPGMDGMSLSVITP